MYPKHKVFVYGTLKQGFSNHFFCDGSQMLGRARTVKQYAMFESDYPLVYKYEAVSRIKGEVYEVDDADLRRMDGLEGHPEYYRRELVDVVLETGEFFEAWLYFYPRPEGRPIPDGEWSGAEPLPED